MIVTKTFLTVLLTVIVAAEACSQTNSAVDPIAGGLFVGSTPCDLIIKSLLKIPSTEICEFIKWEIKFSETKANTFEMTVLYGESQPNTNGFKRGGKKFDISGNYEVSDAFNNYLKGKLYQLKASGLDPNLFLIAMDKNILHFADRTSHLIVGNGGFGYVVNRIQQ